MKLDNFIGNKIYSTAIFCLNKNSKHLLDLIQIDKYKYKNQLDIKYLIDFTLNHKSRKKLYNMIKNNYPNIIIITNYIDYISLLNNNKIDMILLFTLGLNQNRFNLQLFKNNMNLLNDDINGNNIMQIINSELDLYFNLNLNSWEYHYEYQKRIISYIIEDILSRDIKIWSSDDYFRYDEYNSKYDYPKNYYTNSLIITNEKIINSFFNPTSKIIWVFGISHAIGKQSYCINNWKNNNESAICWPHHYDIYGEYSLPDMGKAKIGNKIDKNIKLNLYNEYFTYYLNKISHIKNIIYVPLPGRLEYYLNKYSKNKIYWFDNGDMDIIDIYGGMEGGIKNYAYYQRRKLPSIFFDKLINNEYILIGNKDIDLAERVIVFKKIFNKTLKIYI